MRIFIKKIIEFLKKKLKMSTIEDLDIDKTDESHLVSLEKGFTMYRRFAGDPLEFQYNDTTFTTKVEPESRQWGPIATNSGNCCMITTAQGAFAETRGLEDRKLYEIVVIKPIDRILDLDKVCEEQGIERQYLHVYETPDGRDRDREKELFKLYGKQIREKRINGVKYRSRRLPDDACYMFYDTLPNLNEYLTYKEITDPTSFNLW